MLCNKNTQTEELFNIVWIVKLKKEDKGHLVTRHLLLNFSRDLRNVPETHKINSLLFEVTTQHWAMDQEELVLIHSLGNL